MFQPKNLSHSSPTPRREKSKDLKDLVKFPKKTDKKKKKKKSSVDKSSEKRKDSGKSSGKSSVSTEKRKDSGKSSSKSSVSSPKKRRVPKRRLSDVTEDGVISALVEVDSRKSNKKNLVSKGPPPVDSTVKRLDTSLSDYAVGDHKRDVITVQESSRSRSERRRTTRSKRAGSTSCVRERKSLFQSSDSGDMSGMLEVKILGIEDGIFGEFTRRKILRTTFGRQLFKTKVTKVGIDPASDTYFKLFSRELDGEIKFSLHGAKKVLLGEATMVLNNLVSGRSQDFWLTVDFTHPDVVCFQEENPGATYKINISIQHTGAEEGEYDELKKENFFDRYTLGDKIGHGAFATVHRTTNKATGEEFAVKMIDISQHSKNELKKLKREIEIMTKLESEYIIGLQETFYDDDNMFIVLELAKSELFDFVVERDHLSEDQTREIIKQLLKGVDHMHRRGVAHRDLKLENILVTDLEKLTIKISDFGLSKEFSKSQLLTACGTPEYVAPEVLLSKPYDQSADIWSIGVITYMLLSGCPPFYGADQDTIFSRILHVNFHFSIPIFKEISNEAKSFISALLVYNPDRRPTARQCLSAPWFRKEN
eukprot:TRINITY_DN929_c0_g1_i4.p1 TRINITY_DN929_c0_g1~~TRINITY_DN929_c0_g1_i4.p1  ORF type:complete len:602 (+),score=118.05 TRINITY_DN929_c0_g1_i4:28-1806(+)